MSSNNNIVQNLNLELIKQYNRCIDWNIDIRNKLTIDSFLAVDITKEIIEDYLSTKKINPKDYDYNTIESFKLEKADKYELQIYSNITYNTTYFWVCPNETEEEYKTKTIHCINNVLTKLKDEIQAKIDKLTLDVIALNNLRDGINW